jgi:predicted RNA binding protein YcfA (HicA-like mRNA interferase family)
VAESNRIGTLTTELPLRDSFEEETLKAREIIKLIERDGWKFVRQTGSHMQFKHDRKPGTVTVPFHGSKDVSKVNLESILKQAGLK